MSNKEEGKRWIIKNTLLILLFFLVSLLYSYVSEIHITEPHTLFTSIDWAIPLNPPSVIVYLFLFYGFLFFAVLYYATLQRAYFNQLILSLIVIQLVAYVVYFLYPVMMIRPYWAPTSIFDWVFWYYVNPQYIYSWLLFNSIQLNSGPFNWMLWNIYSHDTPLNCFPSLHAATSTLVAYGFWQEKRKYGWISWPIAVSVMISTLLVRQHVILDEISGALLALVVGYIFYKKIFKTPENPPQKPQLQQLLLVLVVAEIAMILYISLSYFL